MAFGHGVTRREQAMLDLWEGGMGRVEIARTLGIGRATVDNVISRLGSPGGSTAFETMVRQGSAELLAAQRRAGLVCMPGRAG